MATYGSSPWYERIESDDKMPWRLHRGRGPSNSNTNKNTKVNAELHCSHQQLQRVDHLPTKSPALDQWQLKGELRFVEE